MTLEEWAPPLSEWLAQITPRLANYRLEEWEFLGGRSWTLPCNWRMYVDNFREGYLSAWWWPACSRSTTRRA